MPDSEEPRGRQKGGLARAAALTDERKQEIARRAALARWGAKATHTGNFKQEFGVDVECYVLDDPDKTAVISQTGMARALGLSSRGNALPRFMASKVISPSVGAELRDKIENPLKFQWGTGGAGSPPTVINGLDATVLIDLCKAIIDAEASGRLQKRHTKIAAQAHIIIGASAKSGIKGLVYALAGYAAGLAAVYVIQPRWWFRLLVAAVGSVAAVLLTVLVGRLVGLDYPADEVLRIAGVEAAWSLVMMLPACRVLTWAVGSDRAETFRVALG